MLQNLKIDTKLIISMLSLASIILTIIATITVHEVNKIAEKNAKKIAKETAYRYSNFIETKLGEALEAAKNVATIFESATSGLKIKRHDANAILEHFIEENSQFLAVYLLFEPNAFDNDDKKFVDAKGHDKTGRFLPYWTRDVDEKGFLDPLVEYELPNSYYQIPKQRQKESITEPYIYPVQGRDVLITSLVTPIFNHQQQERQFIGIAGIDIELKQLQKFIKSIEISGFKQAYVTFYSSKGIVIGSKHPEYLGKNIKKLDYSDEFVESVLQNGPFSIEHESKTIDQTVITYGAPVEIGNTDIHWMVTVSISKEELLEESKELVLLIAMISILAGIIVLFVVYFIARSITKPLKQTVEIADSISHGELNIEIENSGKDEIAQLKFAMQEMVIKLTQVITKIKDISATIYEQSVTFNTAAQQVSTGATQQADSAQNIAAAMEEISATINQNSDNAENTNKLAEKASKEAEESSKATEEALLAIESIVKKISIIEDIAGRINLLSLNASIEASRGGKKNGKAFEVIANAIRDLADHSKKAAEEINDLSATTVEAAKKTNTMLQNLFPRVQKTAILVQEICHTSKEQGITAEQVNRSILKLDQITHQTATTSQELTSMSEELSVQASELEDSVSYFKISNETDISSSKKLQKIPLLPSNSHT
ncbi:methyl-accepting chemotaxis protein [Candidatus Halobeggiatoa sp. HSG11]|nr:methyl-accepting chemotaxis protein [Candidatus Halobeggiatoa sp. HSG11]